MYDFDQVKSSGIDNEVVMIFCDNENGVFLYLMILLIVLTTSDYWLKEIENEFKHNHKLKQYNFYNSKYCLLT